MIIKKTTPTFLEYNANVALSLTCVGHIVTKDTHDTFRYVWDINLDTFYSRS